MPRIEGRRYDFRIIQVGSLPLTPDGTTHFEREHRATSTIIWPAGERPDRRNTVVADPCLSLLGALQATAVLERLGSTISGVGRIFITHDHWDHCPNFAFAGAPREPAGTEDAERGDPEPFPGLDAVPCPGHAPDLFALRFTAPRGDEVWAVGDAIIDEAWLRAWAYFWPNGYGPAEIVETWRSVARILGGDLIIPGHGEPIVVTAGLVAELAAGFHRARHADRCPDVGQAIERRLATIEGRERRRGPGGEPADAFAPIQRSVTVPLPGDRAFALFADRLGSWWPPTSTWSGRKGMFLTAAIEPRAGGRWFERDISGGEADWGRVLAWEPPGRLLLSWATGPRREPEPDPAKAGEVEIRFVPEGPAATRIELEHGGFERRGPGGGAVREAMATAEGWAEILARFRAAAGT